MRKSKPRRIEQNSLPRRTLLLYSVMFSSDKNNLAVCILQTRISRLERIARGPGAGESAVSGRIRLLFC